jgi:hypothetical protein
VWGESQQYKLLSLASTKSRHVVPEVDPEDLSGALTAR